MTCKSCGSLGRRLKNVRVYAWSYNRLADRFEAKDKNIWTSSIKI